MEQEQAHLSPCNKSMDSMRCLVMGGTGAVGRHLVEELVRQPQVALVTLLSRRELAAESLPRSEKLVGL
jgi:uncharacterized protein YbjT (DUF2867 family)